MHDHQSCVNMTYLTKKEYHHVLIFTNQPNLVVDSGTHPSLHPNCHHQIIHCKINLQVEYPPPYQRHVWNYAKANKDTILSALQNVD